LEELRTVNKADLHVHLNGAIPANEVRAILLEEGAKLPIGFDVERDLTHTVACASLKAYLTPWQGLRLIPRRPENLSRLVDAVFCDLAANGVRFAELRSSLLYLALLQESSAAEALERLIVCTGVAAERHSLRRGLILTVTRGNYSAVHLNALLAAYDALGRPRDVVGIDLAGDEETPYPAELPALFRDAKARFGLGITVHAGETGRAENVRTAVELFDADRVGHGTAAGEDPWLMDILAKREICVEVCPVSNRLTGAVPPSESHPLLKFQKHHVPFVICSDNPGIHQMGLAHDYAAAHAEGVSDQLLGDQYQLAKRFSFVKDLK
jgi:adenosine deaminase